MPEENKTFTDLKAKIRTLYNITYSDQFKIELINNIANDPESLRYLKDGDYINLLGTVRSSCTKIVSKDFNKQLSTENLSEVHSFTKNLRVFFKENESLDIDKYIEKKQKEVNKLKNNNDIPKKVPGSQIKVDENSPLFAAHCSTSIHSKL